MTMIRTSVIFAAFAALCSAANAAPQCMPSVYGDAVHRAPYVQRTDNSWSVYWYCRNRFIGVVGVGFTCPHSDCLSVEATIDRIRSALFATDPVAALRALWDANITERCDSPTSPARAAACTELREAVKRDMPQEPAPVWVVATNAAYATRPAYPFIAGVRGSTSNGRAVVGSPCDCRTRSVEGRSVYCAVNDIHHQVALCTRVQN